MRSVNYADPILCPRCHYDKILPWERWCEACIAEKAEDADRAQRGHDAGMPIGRLTETMKRQIDEALEKAGAFTNPRWPLPPKETPHE